MRVPGCPLCDERGGHLIVDGAKFRLIRTDEGGFPAFYRVVWNDHVVEFSDLAVPDRHACLDAVVTVEQCLRSHLRPVKVNLASLGNAVPHLHWHVVARFAWDTHFPAPVWGQAQRQPADAEVARIEALRGALEAEMVRRLSRAATA